MGKKRKREHFEENKTFPNFFQPSYPELLQGFKLKGKWSEDFFGNHNPIVLELGCGKGEYTVNLAKKYPEKNFIGIDIKGARMWRGAAISNREQIKNAAFVRTSIELIAYIFDAGEVNELWITFPDPYPNKPRIKKRLTSPQFLDRYMKVLSAGACIHLKTDNEGLFNYTLDVVSEGAHKLLVKTDDLYNTGWDNEITRIQTFYEKMFLGEGMPIKYLCFEPNFLEVEDISFFEKVYEVARLIPFGRVTSYGAIAAYLGSKQSARMVGWAMNSSHNATLNIPAHRVVNRNGELTGKHHFGGRNVMEELLVNEGITVENNRIINFSKVFWDPAKELSF